MRQTNDALTRMRRLRDALIQTLETERRKPARAQLWQPAMDLTASDDAYALRLDLPGVAAKDVQATAEDNVIRVRGTAQRAAGMTGADEVRLERASGAFGRSLRLPADADMGDVSAKLDGGVLTVRVARRQRESSRVEIEIA